MTLGERIKKKRKEKGYSLRELARIMEYHHSTIGKIENGLVDLPQSRIEQFANVLGTTPAYLMGWEEEKNATEVGSVMSEAKQQLLALAESCTDEEASRLLQMVELFLGKQ
jgi:transcriptional regulator with XRE-family HTH domain